MAKASEQFRQSDVTLWGIVALACVGLAVFGSNASLIVPQDILAGLHQPRNSGAALATLRREVSELREDTTRLRRDNAQLLSRIALQEQSGGEAARRIGALEVTMPLLLESRPESGLVDRSSVTASVGAGDMQSFDTEGGSVTIRQTILPLAMPAQPLPAPLAPQAPQAPKAAPDRTFYGVALGAPTSSEQAPGLWDDLSLKLGPLLIGLSPRLSEGANGQDKRIVAGPIEELSAARDLCQRIERISIACMPMPYEGIALAIEAQGG